ncbi:MAG: GNAT family N-acetyltransferase, partial [Acidimicrobiia bacterium]|nr:GNAT family N-acetyltransferase [Acidimicrobiia bacterium]
MTESHAPMEVVSSLSDAQWRQFLAASPDSNIFHTPEMFQVFDATDLHEPELWAVLDADGDVAALFTPVQVSVFGGPSAYLTTRSVAYGGLASIGGTRGERAVEVLLETYRRKVGRRPVFTESRNLTDAASLQPTLARHRWVYEDHLNILIDLTQSADDLWRGIKSNARRNIRNATKSGVTVDAVQSPDDIPAVYEIIRTVYQRLRVPLPPLQLFTAAFEVLSGADMLDVVRARLDDGTVIGALCLLAHDGVVTYWYTGALREYSKLRASDLMVWRALEIAAA